MRVNVCGIGVVSGIGLGVEETLRSLRKGESGVKSASLLRTVHEVPLSEVPYTNAELAALLNLSEKEVYSRTSLLGMHAVAQAVADAGIRLDGNARVGLVSSTSVAGMDLTEVFFESFAQKETAGKLRLVVPHACEDSTRKIASYCGISGFATTLSTACSSAANAILLGVRLIRNGLLDYVVAGGTDALSKFTLNGFNSLMILDKEKCRPFDESRAGLNLGEGAGYVVLAREGMEYRKSYGCVSGCANANDAFHQTASSAHGEGAYLAMKQALAVSGLIPGDISYINAHGTGTPNNDSSEAIAIGRLFTETGCAIPPVSSTKPFTGHTLAAAGGIEAVLSVLAIEKGMIYPSLHLEKVFPESPFIPETRLREGVPVAHVMSNSFGFGGNNATLIFSK